MITRALFAVAVVCGLAACEGGSSQAAAQKGGCTGSEEDCLPDVKFVDTTGKAYPFQQLKGKVVLVNFWATWCHPCQKEIPDLSKLYKKYKDQGVVMLGVLTSDNPSEGDLLNFQSDYEMALVSAAGRTIETRRQARPPFDYSCTDEKVRGAEGRPNGTPTEVPA